MQCLALPLTVSSLLSPTSFRILWPPRLFAQWMTQHDDGMAAKLLEESFLYSFPVILEQSCWEMFVLVLVCGSITLLWRQLRDTDARIPHEDHYIHISRCYWVCYATLVSTIWLFIFFFLSKSIDFRLPYAVFRILIAVLLDNHEKNIYVLTNFSQNYPYMIFKSRYSISKVS